MLHSYTQLAYTDLLLMKYQLFVQHPCVLFMHQYIVDTNYTCHILLLKQPALVAVLLILLLVRLVCLIITKS